MMRRHFISVVMGGSLMILLLAGGAGAPGLLAADLKTVPPAAPVGGSGRPGATAVPAAAPQADPAYQYNKAGKADPFKPFMETDPALTKKREEEQKKRPISKARPISPLQQADIEQFRLLGIAGNENRRVAIVAEGTTKKFYPLFVGTYIGLNEGRVAAILPDRAVVEERIETQGNKTKKMQMRRIPMLLHPEPLEGKP
jgi:Tfp pilus assembly protein PilP